MRPTPINFSKVRFALALGLGASLAACTVDAPKSAAVPAVLAGAANVGVPGLEPITRRLTPEQYENVIADVFGPAIILGGRFEPEMRVGGLLAVGSSAVSMTATGMEQYDVMARKIAAQVVDESQRKMMIPCAPAAANAPDDACVAKFMGKVGRLIYRRPLTQTELAAYVTAAHAATEKAGDFHRGLSLSLSAMLSSPKFLFRQETLEPDPRNPGTMRIDAYAKAARLSFFLWNAGPDQALLAAAESGALNTAKGLAGEVDRMLASPRLETGVRAFFTDNFGFDEFALLTKDVVLFPKFSPRVAADAQEQTLKTIVDLLLKNRGDYRDVFTTKKTFMTQELGAVYRVPVINDGPNGAPDAWQPFEFSADDPRGGILTQVAFTSLHSPPGRGSPTLRGKALREVILCQKVPAPPAAVSFNIVQDTHHPIYKTARERLTAHATESMCTGCHKIIDPMGLALENFDGAGAYRTTENGQPIDTSGALDGVPFDGAAKLGQVIHDHPATSACLVNRLASYALGQQLPAGDAWLKDSTAFFATNGYRLADLMRRLATSDGFYRLKPPAEAPKAQSASAASAQ